MKIKTIRTYKGYDIFYNTEPGFALKWQTLGLNGYLSADTLNGIKQLINKEIKGAK